MKYPRAIKSGSAVVRVYRTPHKSTASGFVFQVAWVAGGARKIQQFTDEARALEEARIRAGQIASGRLDAATIGKPDRDELFAARQLIHGKGQLLPVLREWVKAYELTGGNLIAAAESWGARHAGKLSRIKVRDALAKYLTAKTKAGKAIAEDHASTFASIRSDLGDFYIDSVTVKQLDVWLAKRENVVTRITVRKRIVALWRWSRDKGFLPRDAKTEAELTDRPEEPDMKIGLINVPTWWDLLELIADKLPRDFPALVLSGYAGMRRAEVHGQDWAQINLEEKHLHVTAAKKGTPAARLIPLCDRAVELLLTCGDRKGPVCVGMAVDRVRKIAIESGVTLPENCFRHSYITHSVAATGDIARVSLEAGNSPQIIRRHYLGHVPKRVGESWFAAPSTAEIVPLLEARS